MGGYGVGWWSEVGGKGWLGQGDYMVLGMEREDWDSPARAL